MPPHCFSPDKISEQVIDPDNHIIFAIKVNDKTRRTLIRVKRIRIAVSTRAVDHLFAVGGAAGVAGGVDHPGAYLPAVLNVAGPRHSEEQRIAGATERILRDVLGNAAPSGTSGPRDNRDRS